MQSSRSDLRLHIIFGMVHLCKNGVLSVRKCAPIRNNVCKYLNVLVLPSASRGARKEKRTSDVIRKLMPFNIRHKTAFRCPPVVTC